MSNWDQDGSDRRLNFRRPALFARNFQGKEAHTERNTQQKVEGM